MNAEPPSVRRLLVADAASVLGRRVAAAVQSRGLPHVLVGAPDPAALDELVWSGAVPRRIDLDQPASLEDAFSSADHVFLHGCSQAGLEAIAACGRAGVRHIVYATEPRGSRNTTATRELEEALAASGVAHTLLRPSPYADDLQARLTDVLESGEWHAPTDEPTAYLWLDDLALAAAVALVQGDTGVSCYDISGPQALTVRETAHLIDQVFGCSIDVLVAEEEGVRDEDVPHPTGDFLQLTDRQPRGLLEFLVNHRAAVLEAAGSPARVLS